MFIKDYALPTKFETLVKIGSSAEVLEQDTTASEATPKLKIWKSAFLNAGVESMMSDNHWPQRILEALPPESGWEWLLRGEEENIESENDTLNSTNIFNAVANASGLKTGTPQGNAHVTLEIRAYDQKDHHIGGLEWWEEKKKEINTSDEGVKAFFDQLFKVLEDARKHGADFCVEQVSIIISKDPNSPLMTLTPTLHSDEFYGPSETAISSILEKGFDTMGGGMFVPSTNMEALWKLRPIKLDTLEDAIGDNPVVMTGSGDIANYGGMVGIDGKVEKSNGVPHISSDKPGLSSRLIILMKNKPQTTILQSREPHVSRSPDSLS